VFTGDLQFRWLKHSVEVREGAVTKLVQEGDVVKGVKYRNKDGSIEEALAPLTVVCDGCFSALRKEVNEAQYSLKVRRLLFLPFLLVSWLSCSN